MNDNKSTGNQGAIQRLRSAEALYVLISGCTKEPHIVCDPESFDGETYMFFMSEDAQAKAGESAGGDIDVKAAKPEDRQMLMFYISLYTMGVNALAVTEGTEERHTQLVGFVRRDRPARDPEGKMWVENSELHLTALYYMQELRKQSAQENSPQLREWQEEVSDYSTKGSFIIPVQKEGNGIPVVKLNGQEVYQAIFIDIMEFRKLNREDQPRPLVIAVDKAPQILVAKAVGVLLNPMGVQMPL